MRSILRSAFLASFALTMTWGLSGCEDTTKPAAPPAPTTTPATAEPGKMEPEKGKMEPATTPVDKPAEPK